jgi:hypothetical protein
MPFLVDCDPLGDWRADVTPMAALVAAPAYCLIYQGRARAEVLPVTFSEEDARRLLDTLGTCDERSFGMELAGLRAAPFYAAAFRRESRLMSLIYYYSFRESGDVMPTPVVEGHTIYRIAERILSGHSGIDACYIPLPLPPPRHHVSDGRGSKEVLSFPKVKQQAHGDGVLLSQESL